MDSSACGVAGGLCRNLCPEQAVSVQATKKLQAWGLCHRHHLGWDFEIRV